MGDACRHRGRRRSGDRCHALSRPRRPRHLVLLRPLAVLDARLPHQTPELGRYYKTDVLITGFDIIFFWVAR